MVAEDLLGALIQQGSDPCLIETMEQAEEWFVEIEKATNYGDFTAEDVDPEEWETYCRQLDLRPNQVKRIYWFCGNNAGTYALGEDWEYV